MVWFALGIRAHVEQQCWLGRLCRNQRCQSRPIHARKSTHNHFSRGHCRASVAGGNESICATVHHQLNPYSQRALLFPPYGRCNRIVHGYYFRGINKLNTQIAVGSPAAATKFRFYLLVLTNKDDTYSEITCSGERAIDFSQRRVVATHRVENDFSRRTGFILRPSSHRVCLGLFYLNHLAAFVVSALRANAMWHAWLTAIWTECGLGNPQSIVRTTFAAASF